ncbi:MAG: hypothetical protein DRJ67_05430 [Thermoprotei archaeon]|nr:MAG: hypothetical protein DRJ67_05430 [Thermoprotei archaeon]
MARRCRECVYYLKRSRYCILLGTHVEDPEKPPCLRLRTSQRAPKVKTEGPSSRGGRDERAAYVAVIILLLTCTWLAYSYLALRGRYEHVSSELSRLQALYDSLSRAYLSLKAERDSLLAQLRDFEQKYESLQASHRRLKAQHETLAQRYEELQREYSSLQASYQKLEASYEGLKQRYGELQAEYSELADKYAYLEEAYKLLLQINKNLEAKVKKYLYATYSRVGGSQAVKLVQPNNPSITRLVGAITGGYTGDPTDLYLDLQKLYTWVTRNIKYRRDPTATVVMSTTYLKLLGEEVLNDFTTAKVADYWRSATETLRLRAGDCEDQAILLASMIRAYFLHYVKRNYACYVLCVQFSRGGAHALVIVPVAGQQVVILDPAGRYYTNTWGAITSKPIRQEFNNYQRHWHTKIKKYLLILNEQARILINGDLDDLVKVIYS